jgi:photosystem II stability/assembly factor-like uncharacterized protein
MCRSLSSTISLVVILVLALLHSAFGGTNRWTSHGPEGGSVFAMAVDPLNDMVVYAGTAGGVYKTENAGESWTPIHEGMPEELVSAIAISPADHSTLFAGTGEGKVFKSTDAGQHWVALPIPENGGVRSIVITPQVLYAGTERGLLESRNGGTSWEPSSTLPDARIQFLTLSPEGLLFAGVESSLYVTWRGSEWRRVKNSFGPLAMALGPNRTLYSVTPSSIMRSEDFGNTWKFVTALRSRLAPTSLLVSNTGRLYLGTTEGLFEYENNEWTHPIQGNVSVIASGSPLSQRIYAGVLISGAFTRPDSSSEWISVNRGFAHAVTNDVAVAPFSPLTVYAAMPTGVSRSSDGGNSWRSVESNSTEALAIDPHDPNVVFAAQQSLKKSVDGGETWKIVRENLASAIAVAPSDSTIVYAALIDTMSKSVDGGETWTGIGEGLPFSYYGFYYGYGFTATSVTVAPSDPTTVFVGQVEGLFKSIDGGNSWKFVSSAPSVSALAIDPFNSSMVYAALPRDSRPTSQANGLSISRDGGVTWESAGLTQHEVTAIVVDPASATVLYAGTRDGDVYRSDDRGGGWLSFGEGLSSAEIRRLSIDATGKFLYAATSAGVFAYQISDEIESPP